LSRQPSIAYNKIQRETARWGLGKLPLQRLLRSKTSEKVTFTPDVIQRMTLAYEGALELLRPNEQTDAVKELIAKKIIQAADDECDPATICACALKDLGLPLAEL
jgi:hypothetical protein